MIWSRTGRARLVGWVFFSVVLSLLSSRRAYLLEEVAVGAEETVGVGGAVVWRGRTIVHGVTGVECVASRH